LIEQRLEEMVVRAVDDSDEQAGLIGQAAGAREAGKADADDDRVTFLGGAGHLIILSQLGNTDSLH
jgi:hypothetical protein